MAEEPLTIGDRIRLKREALGWSKNELARRSQVDVGWISRLENGSRHGVSFEVAIRIAEALDVSLNWLAGRREDYESFELALAGELQVGRRPLPLAYPPLVRSDHAEYSMP